MFRFEKELLILKQECFREISGFYHRIVEVFALPGFYAALVGISLLAFREKHIDPTFKDQAVQEPGLLKFTPHQAVQDLGLLDSMTFDNGTYGLYRNIG
jgi:hypothetical protein